MLSALKDKSMRCRFRLQHMAEIQSHNFVLLIAIFSSQKRENEVELFVTIGVKNLIRQDFLSWLHCVILLNSSKTQNIVFVCKDLS